MADFEKTAASVYLEKAVLDSCKKHFGFTSIAGGLTGVLSKLKNIGDGSSALKRNTYVILITDGVQEEIKGCKEAYTDYYRKECLKLKNAGVKIVTIQTGYPEVKHPLYYDEIKPLLPKVTKTLQFCATDAESYLHADDGPAIENAIKIAFQSIFSNTLIKD